MGKCRPEPDRFLSWAPGLAQDRLLTEHEAADRLREALGVVGHHRVTRLGDHGQLAVGQDLLCHPVLLGVCDEILLPSCASYQLNIAHVLDRGPGAEQQYLHRDELVWCHLPRPHPEVQLASIVALEDFSAENGATRIIPGSHRWPLEREPQLDELVAAEMPAGAAIIYLGSTIHGGGPNSTPDRRRRGMHLSYTLGWLRTEENHSLSTPPSVARTLPPTAQALLGYRAHDALAMGGGYLGTVDTRDPMDLLESGEL